MKEIHVKMLIKDIEWGKAQARKTLNTGTFYAVRLN